MTAIPNPDAVSDLANQDRAGPAGEALERLRAAIRAGALADEAALARRLIDAADVGDGARKQAQEQAAEFVRGARANASRSGLIDKFLQEYGLASHEGVTLMRLAEALLRTPDAATADALIRDKVEAGDWAAHKGRSPFPLVNFSTRALMLTAAWLDEVEGDGLGNRLAQATKDLLDRVGEPVIRTSVAQAMKLLGEHFVLGETIGGAIKRARAYGARGYLFSYDMLGEAAHMEEDAQKYFADYKSAIEAIASAARSSDPKDNPGISVKLSALHPRYELGKRDRVIDELGARAKTLAIMARNANIGFNIDAEEANRLDLSLDLIDHLSSDEALRGWDGFGVVVQAYQRRAFDVIEWLGEVARRDRRRLMVRLVKGAYWDAEIKRAQVAGLDSYPVFTRKILTDVSYAACARRLLANRDLFYPQFATHNAHTAAMVREMAALQEGGGPEDYELQRLHGMGEALHDSLIEAGARSRIYAPVGGHRELLPYLVRRLLENGANSSFVNQLFDPELSVEDIVADPVTEARALPLLPNDAIPAPRDLFGGRRLSARGVDDGDPIAIAALEKSAAVAFDPAQRYASLMAGAATPRASSESVSILNPADQGEALGVVMPAGEADVASACTAAAEAFARWRTTPPALRRDILRRAADLLEARPDRFIAIAVRESGKTLYDAVAEVREAVDFLRYYATESEKLEGAPLGVVACISPWNFPLAIFLGQISAALAAGNVVVAKPAEQTPLMACAAFELLYEAGLPRDAAQLLLGDGPSVGAPLVAHENIAGVIFTGSTDVARAINISRARRALEVGSGPTPLIAETGGVNAMIVDSTALLEQAVRDAVASAFQSAGQRCSACRLVCVQTEIADRFMHMLAGAMAELRVGDPRLSATDIGPVIDESARRAIEAHIETMEKSARLIARAPAPAKEAGGIFVRPVAFELKSIADLTQEIFGPVLHVVRFEADALAETIEAINAFGYGLTLGAHTRIDETMHLIAERARVGNLYINRNQIGAVVGVQPFGGERLSGTGPKAGGPHYLSVLQAADSGEFKALLEIDRPGAPVALFDQQMQRATGAFRSWSINPDRRAILARASTQGAVDATGDIASVQEADVAECLRWAASLARSAFEATIELPGPTGEANSLRLRGRGLILCLGGDGKALLRQCALALASGAAIICESAFADRLSGALARAGAPGGLVTGAPVNRAPEWLLTDPRIEAVAFDGDPACRARLAAALASRPGPIVPLLSTRDPEWRFAVERTLTINTTAAGGDVRLLALSG